MTICQECGRGYWSWFTDDLFWNLVMTPAGEAVRDDPGGLLCAECFMARAEAVYHVAGWKLIPHFGYPRRDESRPEPAPVAPRCQWIQHGTSAVTGQPTTFTCGVPESEHPVTGLLAAHDFIPAPAPVAEP
jgi:hypothetical protein